MYKSTVKGLNIRQRLGKSHDTLGWYRSKQGEFSYFPKQYMRRTLTWDPGDNLKVSTIKIRLRDILRSLSRREKDDQSNSSTASKKSHRMQVAINSTKSTFCVRINIRALKLLGPTPTANLSENKTRVKFSGSTVIYSTTAYSWI